MNPYPYEAVAVPWKRPPVDRAILARCNERSDTLGLLYCLGTLAILTASGGIAYAMFVRQQWWLMALALYVHGGLYAFQPQTHEFSHGTVFRTPWLNIIFKRLFDLVYWQNNSTLYKMSHNHHHLYTVHRKSDGEVVLPAPETTEDLLSTAVRVVDVTGLWMTLYDRVYSFFKPFLRNPRRSVWHRYVHANSSTQAQRDLYWTSVAQLLFHLGFGAAAIATGHWFLIVVVSLPGFYGGKWYAKWVHDTMHCGRQPETDDFRLCCRTVRLDPFTAFLYWHMEYHVEHHAFAAVPCYWLGKFHKLTREFWDPPQSLFQAWREMNQNSEQVLVISAEQTDPSAK